MGKPVGPCRFEAERRLFGPEDDPCPAWSTCHVSVKQQHAVTTYSFQCKYKYCGLRLRRDLLLLKAAGKPRSILYIPLPGLRNHATS